MSEIGAEMLIPITIEKLDADMSRFQRAVEAVNERMGTDLRQYL
jgi:hypothetical protein